MARLVLQLERLRALRLTPREAPALQRLLVACREYFAKAEDGPPGPSDASDRIADSLGDARQRLVGFALRGDDNLVAFLDLRLGEPARDEVTLALLLVDPAQRRERYGREIVEAVLRGLEGSRVGAVRLGVRDGAKGAGAFWEAMGFVRGERGGGVTSYELLLA